MPPPDERARQQEFAREEVHLDLPALVAAIVYDPVESDGGRLGRPHGVDLGNGHWSGFVSELDVAEFMRDQEQPEASPPSSPPSETERSSPSSTAISTL